MVVDALSIFVCLLMCFWFLNNIAFLPLVLFFIRLEFWFICVYFVVLVFDLVVYH